MYRKYLLLIMVAVFAMTLGAENYEPVARRMCRKMNTGNTVARRSAATDSATAVQYLGDRHQLVVLASFSDLEFSEADPLPVWEKIFNQVDYQEAPFYGSVHDYFYDQSYGKLNLIFDLEVVALSSSRVKYRSTEEDDENSKYLVQDIIDSLQTRHIDWAKYDWNGDGEVNQILIVYAGLGMNNGGDRNTIWPHQGWLSDHENCESIAVGEGEGMRIVDSYCCVQELTGSRTYGVFGTICHEFSHCLGLPDIYYGNTTFLDHWDLMDSGNYNDGGFRPCGYSGFERMMVGWLTPTELKEETRITDMEALASHEEAYIIYNDAYKDEYYIVENRQKVGWDEPLPGSGIIIFHVNYDENWKRTTVPNVPYKKKNLYIIPANNNTYFTTEANWPYPYRDNDSLTNNSQPASVLINANVDGTKLMSKPITNMSVTNGLASFDFMKNNDEANAIMMTTQSKSSKYSILYTIGNVMIVRYDNGEVRKIMR